MRNKFFFSILVLAALLSACKDDSNTAGGSILEKEDEIYVRTDTFSIRFHVI